MELFEITVNSKYQDIVDDHGPFTAESVTIEILQPFGFSGGEEDFELFQETLSEFTGAATIAVTAAHLQEAVHHSRDTFPDVWRGNWALLVDSLRGVYCPQIVGQHLADSGVKTEGITAEDLQVLQDGPEHKDYWEVWEDVLDNCIIHAEGERFFLVHDEDVFLVPVE